MNKTSNSWAMTLVIGCAILWGTVGVTTRGIYTVSETNALSIGFYRLLFSVPLLGALAVRSVGPNLLQQRTGVVGGRGRDLALMIGLGAMMAFYQVAYFAAIPRLGVTIAVIVTICSAPIMVAVISAVFLKETLTPRVIAALVAAVGGTALLALQQPTGAIATDQAGWGIVFALASGFGYAMLTFFSRALADRYHPLQPITIGFAVGAVLLFPIALASGLTLSYPGEGWGLLVYLGIVPTALAYWLFLLALRTVPATVSSILTLLEPLVGALLAAAFFHETLTPLGWAGAALLLGALVILLVRWEPTKGI